MVLTRNQREQQEREERRANGEYSAEPSDNDSEESAGLLLEGRSRRNPRRVMTLEEEMEHDEYQRQMLRAQKRQMLEMKRLGNCNRGTRPERPAAQKAVYRMMHGESDDELLTHPRNSRASAAAARTPRIVSPKAVSPHPEGQGLVASDEEFARADSENSGGGFVDDAAQDDMRRSMNANKRVPLNHHMGRYLSQRGGGKTHGDASPHQVRGAVGKDEDPPADVTPLEVDASVTFESVGGLPHHILTLREMVMIPLMYPALIERLSLKPPKGVLFVGPPGTGKTLLARALASEGTRMAGGQKITFFLRKGADVLSKWQGESERQLRLLFDEARRLQPSIIFFDEIDGLAPVRHSKQEQSQAALVSTLLAMMDGLNDRGQVIVIGATNRPETLDPALRRPGRFDRELRFPLPDEAGRQQVLKIHMKGQAVEPTAAAHIQATMVKKTAGWSGADVAALCAEASLQALRRSLPQIYLSSQRLLVDNIDVSITPKDYDSAVAVVQPSTGRHASDSDSGMLPPLVLEILDGEVQSIRTLMSQQWVPAARHLAEARFASQVSDCASSQSEMLACALSNSLSKPLSSSPTPFLLQLWPQADDANGAALCNLVAKSAMTSLRTLYTHTFHMPNVGRHNASGMSGSGGETNQNLFISGHGPESFHALFVSLASATPSIGLLLGFDDWLSSASEDEVASFFYNANTITGRDVCLLVPRGIGGRDFGPLMPSYGVVSYSVNEPDATRKRAFVEGVAAIYVESKESIEQYAAMMNRLLPTGAHIHAPWPELEVDSRPIAKKFTSADLSVEREHWEKVEYRRRQLRHILHTWMTGYLNNRRFAPLISADLDFAPEHELYSKWQRHIRGKKIGLQDIMSKLENDEYTCLSAYNHDIDTLCGNVRSFFHMHEFKYRPKAVELKETTLLNMYRIQKSLVKFCEDNKDAVEPHFHDDADSEVGHVDGGKRRRSGMGSKGRNSAELLTEVSVVVSEANPGTEPAVTQEADETVCAKLKLTEEVLERLAPFLTKPITALMRLHAVTHAYCHELRLIASEEHSTFAFPDPSRFTSVVGARCE